jgi:hypothetical protein
MGETGSAVRLTVPIEFDLSMRLPLASTFVGARDIPFRVEADAGVFRENRTSL